MTETLAWVATQVTDHHGDSRWKDMHDEFVSEAKEKEADVLFIGDSLVQLLKQNEVWHRYFEPLHSLNFGISADQTQHVLWRVENGELDNISPRIVVLLVGTNNHDHSAEDVASGIVAIVNAILRRQPEAHVLVLEIPPRGRYPNRARDKLAMVNVILAEKLESIRKASLVSVNWTSWMNEEGEMSPQDFYDYLHFTTRGYEKLCEPLAEEIQNRLGEFGPR